ncbi:hypothetical protein ACIBAC_40670 [Streptomyces sp. NPDC051362]|uniref:hypothetical protein n=1 Tax=Streptomyces sp. NPDC051362 TaxID=3365651 RepID=UPI00379F8059
MPTDRTERSFLARRRQLLVLQARLRLQTPATSTGDSLASSRSAGRRTTFSAGRRKAVPAILATALGTVVLAGCSSSPASTEVSAQEMVQRLESLLPPGKVSGQQGQGQNGKPGTPPPSAQLVLGEGGKAVQVAVTLNRYPLPVPAQFSQCPDAAYHPYSQCTHSSLPGGAQLVLDQSPQDEANPSGSKRRTVLLTSKQGAQVAVSEVSSGKRAAGDSTLPLSLKQLSAIATSNKWKTALTVIPTPPASTKKGSVPQLTGPQISGLIKKLLPPGLHAAHQGGSEGFGHLVVDDGHGKSLVAVNTQRWKPHDPAMTKLFKQAETLPDGTRISLKKGPASQGGQDSVEWSVDTIRKDGLRVVISALNAAAYQLPADRSEPALTTKQLKAIALDTAWQHAAPR